MGLCYFCEIEPRVSYLSYYCDTCRKLKNLGNCYGFDRVYTILNKCCIRDPNQLENKIKKHKKSVDIDAESNKKEEEKGDDIKDYDNPDKIAEDENKEYFLRRKSNNKKSKSKSQYSIK